MDISIKKSVLHWSYRDYQNVPIDLLFYDDSLEEIYLKENFITNIPVWLLQLTNLKFIHLSGNEIEDIPTDIYYLENLEFLDLSNNRIGSIPVTLGNMANLQRFNISGNRLSDVPSSIGQLKKLESLDLSKNQLRSLPIELSECSRLNELTLSDNPELVHIPERVANIASLQSLSADRCNLLYLPAVFAKFLDHVQIFHNAAITHVPMIYEKFFANFINTVQPNTKSDLLQNSPFYLIREKLTGQILVLPIGTRQVFPVPSDENRVTLYDDALHTLNYINLYIPIYNNLPFLATLPSKPMGHHIRNGPIARCTFRKCSNLLYTTYYLMVVKRNCSPKVFFTCNFCCMLCANAWTAENKTKYVQVEYEIVED